MAGCSRCAARTSHEQALKDHAIPKIDLLAVNLYPFESTAASGADFAACVENIDIGGPALIRAGAKNHASVTVVVDPADYLRVLDEMEKNGGATTTEFRKELAAKAFARTGAYDAAIGSWFAETMGNLTPQRRVIAGTLVDALRYGENPHQWGAFYRTSDTRFGVATATQVQGKELSYNNLNDADAAYELVAEFDPNVTAAVAIIKHANPCGVAIASTLKQAYIKALALRSGERLRRRHRAQPQPRCRCGAGDRRDLHRGDHRAGCERRGEGDHRRQEEFAASACRRSARPEGAGLHLPLALRRISRAVARQRRRPRRI